MSISKKLLQAAAGNAGEFVYVEDVFSTYLYEGTGAARTIDNNIALSDEGGLVWLKQRGALDSHVLFDTVNGPENSLSSNSTGVGADYSSYLSFPSAGTTGWNLAGAILNGTGTTWASWTFRKAEKFFDVVAYTGTGTSNRKLAHNLGDVPGCVIIKSTNDTTNWKLWHGNLGDNWLELNNTSGVSAETYFQSAPTETELTLSANGNVNGSGKTYVAYFFASEAGGFGNDENIIKCGSYTGTGSSLDVDLGFEPQWIFIKNSSGGHGAIYDVMRQKYLAADLANAESSFWAYPSPPIMPRATGITIDDTNVTVNGSGNTYIYIAIRRPMKTPESGTEVYGASQDSTPTFSFPPDLGIIFDAGGGATYGNKWTDRLRGSQKTLQTSSTAAEVTESAANTWYTFNSDGTQNTFGNSWGGPQFTVQGFKRATGFFDVVAYTGNGVAGHTLNHNLGVVPELMIVKRRNDTEGWQVYHKDLDVDEFLEFDTGSVKTATGNFSRWNNTRPTDSVFTVGGTWDAINASGSTYINYLFASVAGVSKVGSYTGTGADLNVDCGFSAGARFILIKRTDSTGDWYVWDSARGIVAGNDPYLLLNSTAAEVTSTDYIDPLASGFTVTSSAPAALNASGGTYIFLAIA